MRLDRWFRLHFPAISHAFLQKLLRSGQVRLDAKRVAAGERLKAGQEVRVPASVREALPAPRSSAADRELIERMILFEDEHVLVLNKPFGLAVQVERARGDTSTACYTAWPTGSATGRASCIGSTAIPPACC